MALKYTQYPAFDAADWSLTSASVSDDKISITGPGGDVRRTPPYTDNLYNLNTRFLISVSGASGVSTLFGFADAIGYSVVIQFVDAGASGAKLRFGGGSGRGSSDTPATSDFKTYPIDISVSVTNIGGVMQYAQMRAVCNGVDYVLEINGIGGLTPNTNQTVYFSWPPTFITMTSYEVLLYFGLGTTGADTDATAIDTASSCRLGSKYTYYPDFDVADWDSPPAGILFGPREVLIPVGSTLNKDFLSTDSDNYFQAKIRVDTSAVANGSFKFLMFFEGSIQAAVQILTTALAAQFKVYTNGGASSVISSAAGEYSGETVYLTLKINMVTSEITLDIEAPLLSETLSLTGVSQSPVSPFVDITNPTSGTTGYLRLLEYYAVGATGDNSCAGDPNIPPSAYLYIFKHLLPRSKSFAITIRKNLKQLFDAFAEALIPGIKQYVDLIFLDIFPNTTRQLTDWEKAFGLPNASLLTDQERRDRLSGAWTESGGQNPKYLQDILQARGFDLYVHEWWDPGTYGNGAVDDPTIPTPRDPNSVLAPDNLVAVPSKGYPMNNGIKITREDYIMLAGDSRAIAGEVNAQAGNYLDYITYYDFLETTSDPDTFYHYIYIGGQTFGDIVQIDEDRREELEQLILKIRPLEKWVGMLVEYI